METWNSTRSIKGDVTEGEMLGDRLIGPCRDGASQGGDLNCKLCEGFFSRRPAVSFRMMRTRLGCGPVSDCVG